jgi:ketosteroid isomerase-like protein
MDLHPETADPAAEITDVITRFNDALNAHDIETMMALMTQDCVFENTAPAPRGTRYEGHPSLRAFWFDFFGSATEQSIECEELFSTANRAVMRWTYRWKNSEGKAAFLRGVDIYKVRDGKIAEKLSYVKG